MEHLTEQRFLNAMQGVRRRTTKYENYFHLYDLILPNLPKNPCVLEIGIANGGSLETWKSLFPDPARIIGIDLNSKCLELQEEGFEIHIVDTGDDESWGLLKVELGEQVDLLVDDGGHTNAQQIRTILHGLDLLRPGGWIVIEDVHASFMKSFGNPSRFSTSSFLAHLAADLHRQHPRSDFDVVFPGISRQIDFIIQSSSWVAIKKRFSPSRDVDFAEISYGNDATLMDYDHRWDSIGLNKVMSRLLPKSFRLILKRPLLNLRDFFHVRSILKSQKC